MNKIKNEEKPHKHRTEREYLTIDELPENKLVFAKIGRAHV